MNRKANGLIIGLVVVIVIIGLVGYVGSQVMKTTPSATTMPTAVVNKGDIDRSGAADESDRRMVSKQIGCAKDQPCWNVPIGKTKDGDNPIYVYDLDLDGDESISQADVDLVK